jgi:hypothetical protein
MVRAPVSIRTRTGAGGRVFKSLSRYEKKARLSTGLFIFRDCLVLK